MAFTARNKKQDDFSGILPLWVEELKGKFENLRAGCLSKADIFEDYPNVILTFPGEFYAAQAKEHCSAILQANWPRHQIIYRFREWKNRPACKSSQHQILKRYDPTHLEEICDVCKPRYGCKRSVFT